MRPHEPTEWDILQDDGFIGHVGPVLVRREATGPLFGFLAEAKHRNLRDVVQGGMLMTFADRAMGQTVRETLGTQPLATIQFDIHFVSPARLGELITTQPRIVKATTSVIFVHGVLEAGDRVVATASGIWKRLRSAPAA